MKYLCLVYQEATAETLAGCGGEAFAGDAPDYREELRQSGRLVVSARLQPMHAATTVRVRNGSVSVTAGSAADAKEQLGAVHLIEARDLNDAIRVAMKLPWARLGSIDIRPLCEEERQR